MKKVYLVFAESNFRQIVTVGYFSDEHRAKEVFEKCQKINSKDWYFHLSDVNLDPTDEQIQRWFRV